MAVIFAIVGGGAVVGIATSDPYSDYSNHSDYSNYGNYSNYSDAAERLKRRREAKEAEIRQGVENVNQYKINRVNGYLESRQLISEPGETVSVGAVERDGYGKIDREEKKDIASETKSARQEVDEIDAVLAAIDRILEEKRQ